MFSVKKISIYKFPIYKFPIYIIFLLLLLSLILYLFKKNIIEGLDDCPPIKGNTTAGIKNSAGIKSIKKSISKIDNLKKQIDENTTNITQLNVNVKNVLDLKQKVNDLSKSTDSLQKSLKNLADSIQQKGLSAVGATKKDLKKPVPIITDNPHTGEYRTK